jgi:hypothetical protein
MVPARRSSTLHAGVSYGAEGTAGLSNTVQVSDDEVGDPVPGLRRQSLPRLRARLRILLRYLHEALRRCQRQVGQFRWRQGERAGDPEERGVPPGARRRLLRHGVRRLPACRREALHHAPVSRGVRGRSGVRRRCADEVRSGRQGHRHPVHDRMRGCGVQHHDARSETGRQVRAARLNALEEACGDARTRACGHPRVAPFCPPSRTRLARSPRCWRRWSRPGPSTCSWTR